MVKYTLKILRCSQSCLAIFQYFSPLLNFKKNNPSCKRILQITTLLTTINFTNKLLLSFLSKLRSNWPSMFILKIFNCFFIDFSRVCNTKQFCCSFDVYIIYLKTRNRNMKIFVIPPHQNKKALSPFYHKKYFW